MYFGLISDCVSVFVKTVNKLETMQTLQNYKFEERKAQPSRLQAEGGIALPPKATNQGGPARGKEKKGKANIVF